MRVTVGGFDVNHRVERSLAKRQDFRVARHKRQPVDVMTLLAKRDAGRIQVEPRITRRPQGTREPRGTATVTTAHLEDRFPRSSVCVATC